MQKLIGSVVLGAFLCVPLMAFGSCAEFEAEAEAFEGVVPRFNENGSLAAMLMYGDASFIVAKRSLIIDARRKAQMRATRAFTEFVQSNFSAETVAQEMINTVEVTDGQGNTKAMAEELASTLNTMKQSSEMVLSGIVKLDECVDSEQKYVIVAMGWKPEYSEAAAGVAGAMAGDESSDAQSDEAGKITESKGYRKKSKLADDF